MAEKPPKLIVDYHAQHYYIMWCFEDADDGIEDGGYLDHDGSLLSDQLNSEEDGPEDQGEWEHWIACRTVAALENVEHDGLGFFWDTENAANKARAAANRAIKAGRGAKKMPEWAEKALAAGWKPPKGWKP